MIHNVEQYSQEWWALRLGKFTASAAPVWMSKLDTPGLQGAVKMLAWERVYGASDLEYQNEVMKRGHRMEPAARAAYEFEFGPVEVVGLVTHDELPNVAASPDGMRFYKIGKERVARPVEIKSLLPNAWMAAQLGARKGEVPTEHRWQCRWQAWAASAPATDFWAYHPQPGGVRVVLELTDAERSLMTERVGELEASVLRWVERLSQ